MLDLRLSFISAYNERVEPLMNGTIEAEGIELIPTYSHPSETFWRHLKFQEFELGEMSMSSYLIARSRGLDMIAIPVFPSRRFFHADLSYHDDSGIKEPGDLVGKRIGVNLYEALEIRPRRATKRGHSRLASSRIASGLAASSKSSCVGSSAALTRANTAMSCGWAPAANHARA